MGRMTKNLFYGISNFISRSYINLLHGNRLWVCLICVFLFLCFFITQSQVQHLTSNMYGTLLVSWPRPLIYILCMHKNTKIGACLHTCSRWQLCMTERGRERPDALQKRGHIWASLRLWWVPTRSPSLESHPARNSELLAWPWLPGYKKTTPFITIHAKDVKQNYVSVFVSFFNSISNI